MEKINYQFKILYALGIVFIVACHCMNGGIELFYDWFAPYSFHLGIFAFCSGYFYKEEAESAIGKYLIKKVKRLLIPLYLWNFFYAGLILIFDYLEIGVKVLKGENNFAVLLHRLILSPMQGGVQFEYNMGGWFVASLLMVQILNVCFRRVMIVLNPKYKEHVIVLLYLLLGVIGNQIAIKTFLNKDFAYLVSDNYIRTSLILNLVRTLFFLPFFGAGFYYKKILEKRDVASNGLYFAVVMTIQLIMILIFKRCPQYTPGFCNDFTEGPILPIIVGFTGIAFWLRIARILEPSIGMSKIVNMVADNTFSIMINQFLGFFAVNSIYNILHNYSLCSGFDINQFKTDLYYVYFLRGMEQSLIIYLVAGIFIPVAMQFGINYVKKFFSTYLRL